MENPNKENFYLVEEFHRGKWQPLKTDKGHQKFSKITDEQAELMNNNAESKGIRYVLGSDPRNIESSSKNKSNKKAKPNNAKSIEVEAEEVVATKVLSAESPEHKVDLESMDKKELKSVYEEVIGKKPFHGWDEHQLIERIKANTNS